MPDFDENEAFYEEDEPAEKIFAAFDHAEKGITSPSSFYFILPSVNIGDSAVEIPVVVGTQIGRWVTDDAAMPNSGETLALAG